MPTLTLEAEKEIRSYLRKIFLLPTCSLTILSFVGGFLVNEASRAHALNKILEMNESHQSYMADSISKSAELKAEAEHLVKEIKPVIEDAKESKRSIKILENQTEIACLDVERLRKAAKDQLDKDVKKIAEEIASKKEFKEVLVNAHSDKIKNLSDRVDEYQKYFTNNENKGIPYRVVYKKDPNGVSIHRSPIAEGRKIKYDKIGEIRFIEDRKHPQLWRKDLTVFWNGNTPRCKVNIYGYISTKAFGNQNIEKNSELKIKEDTYSLRSEGDVNSMKIGVLFKGANVKVIEVVDKISSSWVKIELEGWMALQIGGSGEKLIDSL